MSHVNVLCLSVVHLRWLVLASHEWCFGSAARVDRIEFLVRSWAWHKLKGVLSSYLDRTRKFNKWPTSISINLPTRGMLVIGSFGTQIQADWKEIVELGGKFFQLLWLARHGGSSYCFPTSTNNLRQIYVCHSILLPGKKMFYLLPEPNARIFQSLWRPEFSRKKQQKTTVTAVVFRTFETCILKLDLSMNPSKSLVSCDSFQRWLLFRNSFRPPGLFHWWNGRWGTKCTWQPLPWSKGVCVVGVAVPFFLWCRWVTKVLDIKMLGWSTNFFGKENHRIQSCEPDVLYLCSAKPRAS